MPKLKKKILLALTPALSLLSLSVSGCGGTAQPVVSPVRNISFKNESLPQRFLKKDSLILKIPEAWNASVLKAIDEFAPIFNAAHPNYTLQEIKEAFKIETISLDQFLNSASLVTSPNNDPNSLTKESDLLALPTYLISQEAARLVKFDPFLFSVLTNSEAANEFIVNGSAKALPFSNQTPLLLTKNMEAPKQFLSFIKTANSSSKVVLAKQDLALILQNLVPLSNLVNADLSANQDLKDFLQVLKQNKAKITFLDDNDLATKSAAFNSQKGLTLIDNEAATQYLKGLGAKANSSADLIETLKALKLQTLPKLNANIDLKSYRHNYALVFNREKLINLSDFKEQALKATVLENFLATWTLNLAPSLMQNNLVAAPFSTNFSLPDFQSLAKLFSIPSTLEFTESQKTLVFSEYKRLALELLSASQKQNLTNLETNQNPQKLSDAYQKLVTLVLTALKNDALKTSAQIISFIVTNLSKE